MLETLRAWLGRIRLSPAVRRVALVVSSLFLIAGIAFALHEHPDLFRELDWVSAGIVLAVGVPVTVLFNAGSFMVTGRLVDKRFGPRVAVEVSIVSTAANLLPLPGGPLTRAAALKGAGAGLRESGMAILLVALLRTGMTLAYSGAWIGFAGHWPIGGSFVAGGVLLTVAGSWRIGKVGGASVLAAAWLVQAALILIDMGRIALCLMAVGEVGSVEQASALTVSGVAGSLVGIVPGGLGVREAVAAALGTIVSVPPAIAFVATVLNRIVGMVGTTPMALWLAGRRPSEPPRPPAEADDPE